MKPLAVLFVLMLSAAAQTPETALSKRLKSDVAVTADPAAQLWQDAPVTVATHSARNTLTAGHRTEIRSRWTAQYLYFLFTCPYDELYLIREPATDKETNRLWEHDVAEIFIGADSEKIWQYREYQVSPQAEWVDLDIDRKNPKPEGGARWNSGYTVAARVDAAKKVWYGAMKIPVASITERGVKSGFEFRVNYFRFQGPPPERKNIAWRPTNSTGNHHVPEAFGLLKLEE